jgi:hypothetical protein
LAAINAVRGQLDAIEWRRECIWLFTSLERTAGALQERFPAWEQTIQKILEPLDCYANVVFKSAQDLRIVFICLGLVAGVFEEVGKLETPSSNDLWQKTLPLIDDLGTLESGDPPLLSAAERLLRDLRPELQDAERASARERFDQRSRDSIKKSFARRREEAEKYY